VHGVGRGEEQAWILARAARAVQRQCQVRLSLDTCGDEERQRHLDVLVRVEPLVEIHVVAKPLGGETVRRYASLRSVVGSHKVEQPLHSRTVDIVKRESLR